MTGNLGYKRELKIIDKKDLKNGYRIFTYAALGLLGGFSLNIGPRSNFVDFSENPIISEYEQTNDILAQFKRKVEEHNIIIPIELSAETRERIHKHFNNSRVELEGIVEDLRQDSLKLSQIVKPYTQFEEDLDKESNTYRWIGGASCFLSVIGCLGISAFLGRKSRKAKEQLKQKYHIE